MHKQASAWGLENTKENTNPFYNGGASGAAARAGAGGSAVHRHQNAAAQRAERGANTAERRAVSAAERRHPGAQRDGRLARGQGWSAPGRHHHRPVPPATLIAQNPIAIHGCSSALRGIRSNAPSVDANGRFYNGNFLSSYLNFKCHPQEDSSPPCYKACDMLCSVNAKNQLARGVENMMRKQWLPVQDLGIQGESS